MPLSIIPCAQTEWVPDKDAKVCQLCSDGFGLTTRRHHCRGCGQVLCSTCAPKSAKVDNTLVRCCAKCLADPKVVVGLPSDAQNSAESQLSNREPVPDITTRSPSTTVDNSAKEINKQDSIDTLAELKSVPDSKFRQNARIEDEFIIRHDIVLGSGVSSIVKLCERKKHDNDNDKDIEEFAVKIIEKNHATIDISMFREEIRLLARVNHPNILGLEAVFETDDKLFVVTELAYGGELFDRILDQKQYSERDAVEIVSKLVSAVSYLHGLGIIHRDLKPENILYTTREADAELKIVDFGFATNTMTAARGAKSEETLGTRGYAAPEIFSGSSYTEKCDIWSLGVITYILLCGLPPFVELEEGERPTAPFWLYVNKMKNAPDTPLTFPEQLFKDISGEAKHFCMCCLTINPLERKRGDELLEHPWFLRRLNVSRNQSMPFRASTVERINSPINAEGEAEPWQSPTTRERKHTRIMSRPILNRCLTMTLSKFDFDTVQALHAEGGDEAVSEYFKDHPVEKSFTLRKKEKVKWRKKKAASRKNSRTASATKSPSP